MSLLARSFQIAVAGAVFAAFMAADFHFPSQSVPWGMLDLKAPVGFFTDTKLAAMRDDAALCHAALKAGGTVFTPVPDEKIGKCDLENRVSLGRSDYAYSDAVKANCGLIAALTVWERNVVAPAAQKYLPSPVERIDHIGTFSCRTIRGSERMSNHSTANAIDIAGFRLKNGQRISLLKDWGKDTPEGDFLRAVRDGSCPVFRGVLGPDYNEDHRDHFHLDLGRFNICR